MYGWLWRVLPGGTAAKSLACLVLFALIVAVLFAWVFPLLDAQVPFDNTTVQ